MAVMRSFACLSVAMCVFGGLCIRTFPVFPPGTKSLLSKFLMREVFELKDKVTPGGISLRVRELQGC
jgi:hypothetical protein